MSNIDPNDFINSASSVKSASFDTVGDTLKGVITAVDVSQARKFGTQDLDWWDDAKTQPKMNLVVTLQTDLRENADDDGRRRLYALKPSNMLQAVGEALKGAGAKAGLNGPARLEAGGTLAVRFTGQRPHEKPGFNPIKEYAAAYAPPANSAADDLLGAGGQPAPATPPQQQPAPAPAPQPSASEDLLGV